MREPLIAAANEVIQKIDPNLSFMLNEAGDPMTEDDELELMLCERPLRHTYSDGEASYSIQLCAIGGGFSANCYRYRGGEFEALVDLYFGDDIRAAAKAIGDALEGSEAP